MLSKYSKENEGTNKRIQFLLGLMDNVNIMGSMVAKAGFEPTPQGYEPCELPLLYLAI